MPFAGYPTAAQAVESITANQARRRDSTAEISSLANAFSSNSNSGSAR